MALKFSEMIALRTDLAHNLEAGLEKYLVEIAGGYGDYLSPLLADGETALDVNFQLELLKRSVERHRQQLEGLDQGVLEQAHEDEKVRAELTSSRDAVQSKLRLLRHACRGFFGTESLGRIGLVGKFPRGPARLYRLGLVVKASLENPELGLTPLLELDLGSEEGVGAPAQLAAQLDPELSELGELVTARHQERRKTVDIRLRRQQLIQDFDHDIRGVVRMAQGMFRLAGRNDLGKRFRPIFQRAIRKLKNKETDGEAQPAPEGDSIPGSGVAPDIDTTPDVNTAPDVNTTPDGVAAGPLITPA